MLASVTPPSPPGLDRYILALESDLVNTAVLEDVSEDVVVMVLLHLMMVMMIKLVTTMKV